MADKQKKGQKYGRNRDRNPSSKLQKLRTEKNKRLRAEKAKAEGRSLGQPCPKHPQKPRPLDRVTFGGVVPEHRVWQTDEDGHKFVAKMPHLVIKNGVTTDVVR